MFRHMLIMLVFDARSDSVRDRGSAESLILYESLLKFSSRHARCQLLCVGPLFSLILQEPLIFSSSMTNSGQELS